MSDQTPKAEDTIPARRTAYQRGDGLGVCHGLMIAAGLWSVVAIVAILVGSTGDAHDDAKTQHTIIVDRGGHH
jgi:hypothetical protein